MIEGLLSAAVAFAWLGWYRRRHANWSERKVEVRWWLVLMSVTLPVVVLFRHAG